MILSSSISSCLRVAALGLCLSFLVPDLCRAEEKFEFPQASQPATIKQRVGLTDVEINYSRPDMRGREIFGGLVPFGKIWRTGANEPTKVKFSDAVKIGGQEVPAGEYAFYTIPNQDEWTIILSKNLKLWGAYGYKPDADALRVTVKPTTIANPIETFTIGFDDLKDNGGTVSLEWEKTRVPIELTTNTVEKVNQEIEQALQNPNSLKPIFYYQAASFYYDHDKDLGRAAKWIDQAIEKQQPTRYFLYYKKAQIEARLGHNAEAKAAAEKSIELLKAEKEPDETAIRNSQQLIEGLH